MDSDGGRANWNGERGRDIRDDGVGKSEGIGGCESDGDDVDNDGDTWMELNPI